MTLREKTYADYGLTENEVQQLKQHCRGMPDEEKQILMQAAASAAPGLEVYIYASLINGIGFDRLKRTEDIPLAKRDDFYAYQRATLDLFSRMKKLLEKI